ncbi:MAG: hypothetical protein COB24_12660 [Hyphomicrobiales bacterium]|nr:MAG: hypothetical protein COB24_12660 [Hyphomicrobiales bacterium]
MDYFRNLPNHPEYKTVTRIYKNAAGLDEIIIMTKVHWDYVAWLEAEENIDFAKWVVHFDKNPHEDWTLSHQLIYWLWYDECNRFRQGCKTPNSYPPMGYEGWGDEEWQYSSKN